MSRLELDPAGQALVESFRADPTGVTLTDPAHVYAAAYSLNWGDTGGAERVLLEHPACELATALVLFWHGGAGTLMADCASPEAADEEFYKGAGKGFRFLMDVHDAVVSGKVTQGALAFDPRSDEGGDWTEGLAPDEFAFAIDARLFQKVGNG